MTSQQNEFHINLNETVKMLDVLELGAVVLVAAGRCWVKLRSRGPGAVVGVAVVAVDVVAGAVVAVAVVAVAVVAVAVAVGAMRSAGTVNAAL